MAVNPQYERPVKGGVMSFSEYQELERRSPHAKYEYLNGRARFMAGGSLACDLISFNVRTAIDINFRAGPCHVCGSDMKVLLGTKSDRREHRVYPDVTASCDEIYRKIDFTAIVEEEE
jgi:Uma2 family endonuclease